MLQGILACEVNCLSSRWCVVPWNESRKIRGSIVSVEASCVNLAVVAFLATVATADKANFRPILSQRNRRQTWSRRTTFLFQSPPFSFNTGLFSFSFSFIPLLFHVIKSIQLANTDDVPRTNWKWTTPVRLRLNSLYTLISAEETSVFTSCFSWNCTELLLI